MEITTALAEKRFEESRTETYSSEHYLFHYQSGSVAEKEILQIAEIQENAFSRICAALQVDYPEKINYFFCDSPLEIGSIFWDEGTPCNGVALCGSNKIYAVYNEEIKCIGAHEDTHLISFLINYPQSDFIVEGLAMSFDGLWWGVSNEVWTSYHKSKNASLSVEMLLDNNAFAECGCAVTYPIAGAFTKYVIDTYGIEKYTALYKYDGDEYGSVIQTLFGIASTELEKTFWEQISKVAFDAAALEKMLKDEGF